MCSAKSFAGLWRTSNKYKLCPTKITLLALSAFVCTNALVRGCGLNENRKYAPHSAKRGASGCCAPYLPPLGRACEADPVGGRGTLWSSNHQPKAGCARGHRIPPLFLSIYRGHRVPPLFSFHFLFIFRYDICPWVHPGSQERPIADTRPATGRRDTQSKPLSPFSTTDSTRSMAATGVPWGPVKVQPKVSWQDNNSRRDQSATT
jgi:hypothetical protein